jgi:hypothetical protein
MDPCIIFQYIFSYCDVTTNHPGQSYRTLHFTSRSNIHVIPTAAYAVMYSWWWAWWWPETRRVLEIKANIIQLHLVGYIYTYLPIPYDDEEGPEGTGYRDDDYASLMLTAVTSFYLSDCSKNNIEPCLIAQKQTPLFRQTIGLCYNL